MRAGIGAFGYMALAHSLHLPDNLLQKKRVALVSHRNKQEEDYPTSLSRRCLLFLGPAVLSSWREPSLAVPSSSQFAPTTPNVLESITMPLLWNGAAYCIYYRVDGTLFRAVVDSGTALPNLSLSNMFCCKRTHFPNLSLYLSPFTFCGVAAPSEPARLSPSLSASC